ncbi:hypothetical protein GYMLUDRAFT_100679 [Collybiopsis luxurians FD-317 M1]|uniref:Uncharacterized protein n=1 Tax=Collybiopsis luxurians FD-317 M1 TaxID=944289 RepID=A0A0D0AQA1_9AGAR|nr:hypothetical protein GYMLUDRAFT_100679 [Collybiopsis luxurians FD-317 M1]
MFGNKFLSTAAFMLVFVQALALGASAKCTSNDDVLLAKFVAQGSRLTQAGAGFLCLLDLVPVPPAKSGMNDSRRGRHCNYN